MCTVSFVRVNDAVVITSNRDEHIRRPHADAPALHQCKDKKLIYPRDAKAGGTWFAAADTGTVCVLLNGAFEKHIPVPPYRKSRGLVLLEVMESASPLLYFNKMDLLNIEPFTLVLYHHELLYELRWDGTARYETQKDVSDNHIWSSATLYNEETITLRRNLFEQFLQSVPAVSANSIHEFHASDNGDNENGFVICRPTGMTTFSITQAVVTKGGISFQHTDLQQQKQYTSAFPVHQHATTG